MHVAKSKEQWAQKENYMKKVEINLGFREWIMFRSGKENI